TASEPGRAYREGLARQNAEHQRLEIERARQQIIDERLSIARELHDILAHSLSVIAIQSGVGRHVMDQQPDQARHALVAVEETSRSALEELRHVIAVLRRADDDPAHEPAPTLPTSTISRHAYAPRE
ncbi:multi-sensor hybrid histidine kinase, partial [mine drainage metagenome]